MKNFVTIITLSLALLLSGTSMVATAGTQPPTFAPQEQQLTLSPEEVAKLGNIGLFCAAIYTIEASNAEQANDLDTREARVELAKRALQGSAMFARLLGIPLEDLQSMYATAVDSVGANFNTVDLDRAHKGCEKYMDLTEHMTLETVK